MNYSLTSLALLAGFLLPSFSSSQQDAVPTSSSAPLSISVAAVGASLAAGTSPYIASVNDDSEDFSHIHQYQDVLAALEPAWKMETFAEMMFFSKPVKTGEEVLTNALASPRQVILALDYLFWFGYGDKFDEAGKEGATRLAFLEKEGFPRLERLWDKLPEGAKKPFILIGTMPDVRDSTVLAASQKPSDEELKGLNAAIIEWAAKHPHVLVVPFAERLAKIREKGGALVGTQTFTEKDLPKLMLNDRLHPSTKGSALIATLCLETLNAAEGGDALVASDTTTLDPRAIANELIAARKASGAEAVPASSGR